MDNLTHSLIGAVLGQAGLKRKTGLAMPTLITAANLPDIDAGCSVLGMVSLEMRRGVTHGPIALLLLPALLAWAMIAFDRWQARRGKRPADRPPVHAGWLLALAYIGCLSHPLFDWMNSYGIRLLEPFSHRWFYGDALFIVDPWLLAMLIAGVWLSRRWDKAGRSGWRRPAQVAIAGVLGYVALNLAISQMAAQRLLAAYASEIGGRPDSVVANPVPLAFWQRDVLWRGTYRDNAYYGSVAFDALSDAKPQIANNVAMNDFADPRVRGHVAERTRDDRAARAFLFWARMPVAELRGDTIRLRDQRFIGSPVGDRFNVELKP